MPITFSVKIARLKMYMTIAGPITLTFIQNHKCVANLATFKLAISQTTFKLFNLGMTVNLYMAYMLMLVSMTLTLMQGHSGSAKANKSALHSLGN